MVWVPWVVIVGRGRGGGSCVGRRGRVAWFRLWFCCSLPFRLSFRRSLRSSRRRGAQLLPSLCRREIRVGGAWLRLGLLHSIADRAAAASLRLGGVAGLALALQARVGCARLRLTLSHNVAARTAAARLRLDSRGAPRLLRSLCIRGWAVRGSDLHSRTASRFVLHCCGKSGRRGARTLAPALHARGVARCFDLRPRTSLRLVLLRRTRAARGAQLLLSLCTREWAARGCD